MKSRSLAAVSLSVLAWVTFGVMVFGPALHDDADAWFSYRLAYAVFLTPVSLMLAFGSFLLAGESGKAAASALLAAVGVVLYWAVPWVLEVI